MEPIGKSRLGTQARALQGGLPSPSRQERVANAREVGVSI